MKRVSLVFKAKAHKALDKIGTTREHHGLLLQASSIFADEGPAWGFAERRQRAPSAS